MNDKELLKLAAKAASYEVELTSPYEAKIDGEWQEWNPLEYDSHALRLAAKLRVAITYPFGENCVRCWHGHEGTEPVCLDLGDDPYAATRRAIVRAATEIGKAIK